MGLVMLCAASPAPDVGHGHDTHQESGHGNTDAHVHEEHGHTNHDTHHETGHGNADAHGHEEHGHSSHGTQHESHH